MTLATFFDLDVFCSELLAELIADGVPEQRAKRAIAAALRHSLESAEGEF